MDDVQRGREDGVDVRRGARRRDVTVPVRVLERHLIKAAVRDGAEALVRVELFERRLQAGRDRRRAGALEVEREVERAALGRGALTATLMNRWCPS
jgi:hypothetical protein